MKSINKIQTNRLVILTLAWIGVLDLWSKKRMRDVVIMGLDIRKELQEYHNEEYKILNRF
ncbi:hypothetical protein GZ77_13250 [Endozoicomonas montiporae]|uniref:Uncharacterized protein n=2 Tax=Endozoicomonas montiporae TaxID=1027273 RepID=A0A081N4J7_9GAMM|nr:hypothetical protein EZMO1_3823 [Endozoicomonas montiporae CL-33]KEQ13370.1 hypothetical protein GZ77_13250 [Endozoicomonas montiporae]